MKIIRKYNHSPSIVEPEEITKYVARKFDDWEDSNRRGAVEEAEYRANRAIEMLGRLMDVLAKSDKITAAEVVEIVEGRKYPIMQFLQ